MIIHANNITVEPAFSAVTSTAKLRPAAAAARTLSRAWAAKTINAFSCLDSPG
jgi:hypothetical protein